MRKVRHELGLVDKRVPSGGSLGGPGGSTYCSWDSVGHVCTLMLQALQWAPPAPPPQGQGAADATSPSAAATTPARSTGPNGNAADNAQPAMRNDVDGAGGDPASSSAAAQGTATPANDTTASTPPRGGGAGTGAGAAGAVAATLPGGPSGSGSNTPGRGAGSGTDSPGGARAGAGAVGTSMPAPLATEAGLVRALSHKHVVAHARKVLRGIPEEYRAALGRLLLGKLVREMQVGGGRRGGRHRDSCCKFEAGPLAYGRTRGGPHSHINWSCPAAAQQPQRPGGEGVLWVSGDFFSAIFGKPDVGTPCVRVHLRSL